MADPTTSQDVQETTAHVNSDSKFIHNAGDEVAGRYRLLDLLGEGGMGQVWRAFDTLMNRDVALKFMQHDARMQPNLARRFEEESRITAQLQHPGIVPIHDFGFVDNHLHFFTMRVVKGDTFTELLRPTQRRSDDITRMVQILLDVTQVLAYAHSRKVIHRDLKPDNVMVGAFGETQVMDWGLAKVLTDSAVSLPESEESSVISTPRDSDLTQAGSILGTWPYMAPEQARGHIDQVDTRVDVFSLGSILCEILTGKPAYHGQGFRRQAKEAQLDDATQRLDACGADPELIAIARACLSEKPEDRYASAVELADALEQQLQSVQTRLQEERLAKEREAVQVVEEKRRRRWQLGVAVAVLLIMAGVAAVSFLAYAQLEEKRREQEVQFGVANAALDEAERFLRQRNDTEAKAALKNASIILGETGDPNQRYRLKQLRETLQLAQQLEEIRLNTSIWLNAAAKFDFASALVNYPATLTPLGYDVLNGKPDQVAARIKQSVIADRLVTALDAWTEIAHRGDSTKVRDRVMIVASQADSASEERELRRLLRTPGAWDDPKMLIARLEETDARKLSPELILLANSRMHDDKMAIKLIQECLITHPKDFWLHFQLGHRFHDQYVYQIGCFRSALAIRPDVAAAWYNVGFAYHKLGDLQSAVPAYQQAIAVDPNDLYAYSRLGDVYLEWEQLPEALTFYRKAVEIYPKYTSGHEDLGKALARAGDLPGAIAEYEKVIALVKGNPDRIERAKEQIREWQKLIHSGNTNRN